MARSWAWGLALRGAEDQVNNWVPDLTVGIFGRFLIFIRSYLYGQMVAISIAQMSIR